MNEIFSEFMVAFIAAMNEEDHYEDFDVQNT